MFGLFSQKKKEEKTDLVYTPLSEDKMRELILFSEEREIKPRLPLLTGLRALEIAPRHRSLTPMLNKVGAKLVTCMGGTKEKEISKNEGEFVLSHWETFPFLENSWDFVLFRSSFLKSKVTRMVKEAGRILKRGGIFWWSELHPFSSIVQKENMKNPVVEEGLEPGFERVAKAAREAGFQLDLVKEVFVDGSL